MWQKTYVTQVVFNFCRWFVNNCFEKKINKTSKIFVSYRNMVYITYLKNKQTQNFVTKRNSTDC